MFSSGSPSVKQVHSLALPEMPTGNSLQHFSFYFKWQQSYKHPASELYFWNQELDVKIIVSRSFHKNYSLTCSKKQLLPLFLIIYHGPRCVPSVCFFPFALLLYWQSSVFFSQFCGHVLDIIWDIVSIKYRRIFPYDHLLSFMFHSNICNTNLLIAPKQEMKSLPWLIQSFCCK